MQMLLMKINNKDALYCIFLLLIYLTYKLFGFMSRHGEILVPSVLLFYQMLIINNSLNN